MGDRITKRQWHVNVELGGSSLNIFIGNPQYLLDAEFLLLECILHLSTNSLYVFTYVFLCLWKTEVECDT